MNRTYELMFIVRPDMPEEEQSKLISTLESADLVFGRHGEKSKCGASDGLLTRSAGSTKASICC